VVESVIKDLKDLDSNVVGPIVGPLGMVNGLDEPLLKERIGAESENDCQPHRPGALNTRWLMRGRKGSNPGRNIGEERKVEKAETEQPSFYTSATNLRFPYASDRQTSSSKFLESPNIILHVS
jgi:hypothetical protein